MKFTKIDMPTNLLYLNGGVDDVNHFYVYVKSVKIESAVVSADAVRYDNLIIRLFTHKEGEPYFNYYARGSVKKEFLNQLIVMGLI